MAQKAATSPPVRAPESVSVDDLKLDLANPRLANDGGSFQDEEELTAHLNRHEDLEELILSITWSGWLDFEPLIVDEETKVVYEGNRRLAALRLLGNQELCSKLRISLPKALETKPLPDEIRVIFVKGRADARRYIGFKHINGPKKWDAMAKAKYAADWIQEGASVEEVSSALGDTYNTVRRLVNGWYVYGQAVDDGFDIEQRTKSRFAFSHLYTAITRATIRDYLDLESDPTSPLKSDPVPEINLPKLKKLMSWLYGQETEPTVVQSQNPDLNRLADVLGNERARILLETTRRLDQAWEEIDELKPRRLEEALIIASRGAETAHSFLGYYNQHQQSALELAEAVFGTAKKLVRSMRQTRDEDILEELKDI